MFDFKEYGQALARRRWKIAGGLMEMGTSMYVFNGADAIIGGITGGGFAAYQFIAAFNDLPPPPPPPPRRPNIFYELVPIPVRS